MKSKCKRKSEFQNNLINQTTFDENKKSTNLLEHKKGKKIIYRISLFNLTIKTKDVSIFIRYG